MEPQCEIEDKASGIMLMAGPEWVCRKLAAEKSSKAAITDLDKWPEH